MPPTVPHKIVNKIEYKWCSTSKLWKTLDKFSKSSRDTDGLKTQCKECINKKERKRASGTDFNNLQEKCICENGCEICQDPPTIKKDKVKRIEYKTASQLRDKIQNDLKMIFIKSDFTNDRPYVSVMCYEGHLSENIRLDSLISRAREVKEGKRYHICSECQLQTSKEMLSQNNKELVEDRGFILNKCYKNERNDFIFDIRCKNDHLTIGRTKGSFLRSFQCEECREEERNEILPCSGCKQKLPYDSFSKCEGNSHRHDTDHYCKDCRRMMIKKK